MSQAALSILAAALRPDAGGPDAARRRREGPVDWHAVMALANAHYLGPALCSALSAAADWPDLPADLRDYLMLLHRQNGRRNAALHAQAAEIVAACAAEGLSPLFLKGAGTLFVGDYADPAARIIVDLDLLARAAELPAMLAVLRRLGYRAARLYEAGHNAVGDFVRPGAPAAIDLHRRVVDLPWLLPEAEIWPRAVAIDLPEGRLHVLAPADRLLHNLLHAQIHHIGRYYRGSLELRQLYDFVCLARAADRMPEKTPPDWTSLAGTLARLHLLGPLQAWLLAAGELFALPWPLAEPPGLWPRLQWQRCLIHLRWPWLEPLGLPLANLCGAFARHRMDGLYGTARPLLARRLLHLRQFLHKSSSRGTMARLFKAQ